MEPKLFLLLVLTHIATVGIETSPSPTITSNNILSLGFCNNEVPATTMITPGEHAIILEHVLENVIHENPEHSLAIALEQNGCQSILDVMKLTPWEIETLQWTDGIEPKETLRRGPRARVVAIQAFVLYRHPNPDSMAVEDWLALTDEQFDAFRSSSYYILLRQKSPRPVPPPVVIAPVDDVVIAAVDAVEFQATTFCLDGDDPTTPTFNSHCLDTPEPVLLPIAGEPVGMENGEQQLPKWGALDLIESFDVDEFQAAMLRSSEPPCCMKEEDAATKDDPILEALGHAIAFFETFCLETDFEAHAMDDSQPYATVEPVFAAPTKPTTTDNKENLNYSPYVPAEKDAMVHIEYPDRTKFVASMNHEQYEELESYNDRVDVCVVSNTTFCSTVLVHACDDCPNSRCWGVTEFP